MCETNEELKRLHKNYGDALARVKALRVTTVQAQQRALATFQTHQNSSPRSSFTARLAEIAADEADEAWRDYSKARGRLSRAQIALNEYGRDY